MTNDNVEGNGGLSAGERRRAILDLMHERTTVTIREVAERFRVSAMTVHRDLDALEDRGVLRKVRGGATVQPTSLYEGSLAFRLDENRAAKQRIARAAAQRVESGSSVVLDDSTTALAMLPFLARVPELTLISNFVSIFEEVGRMTDTMLRLIGIGGTYHAKYHAFGGVLAADALQDLHVDHCFVSVSAVDVERGAFHQEPEQAAVKRTMIEIADRSTLLADASKFAKRTVHRVVGLDALDAVVVDGATDAATVDRLRSHGLDVSVVAATEPEEVGD